jgi:hypothetical protein
MKYQFDESLVSRGKCSSCRLVAGLFVCGIALIRSEICFAMLGEEQRGCKLLAQLCANFVGLVMSMRVDLSRPRRMRCARDPCTRVRVRAGGILLR